MNTNVDLCVSKRYTIANHYFFMEPLQKKPVDLVDALIIGELLSLPVQLNTKEQLFKEQPDKEAEVNTALQNLADALFAMNEHRRMYKSKEKAAWKEFKREAQKSKVKDIEITKEIPELQQHIVGFFDGVKPVLDRLSQVYNQLLGASFPEWDVRTEEDGVAYAGKDIASFVKEKTPTDKQQFGTDLEQFITSNTRWLGYLTTVTSKKSEDGKLAVISPFIFEQKHRTVIPQLYTHSDGYREPVLNFMNRATQELILFIINTVIFAYQISAKDLMLIKARDRAGHLHYQWVPLEAAQKLHTMQNNTAA